MVGPIQHEDVPLARLPWVSTLVAAAWLALLLLGGAIGPDRILEPLGLVPAHWTPLALIAHPLTHANGVQLLGSLLLLALLAPPLELRLGAARMAGLVALAGPLTGVFYAFMTPASSLALVGPSGVLAALLGASLAPNVSQPFRLTAFAPARGRWTAHWLEIPAYALPPLWLGCEVVVSGLGEFAGSTKGVSGWGPVAGLALGAAFVLALRIPAAGKLLPGEGAGSTAETHLAIEEALIAREQGHHEHALAVLAEAARAHPESREVVSAWWEMASLAGRPSEAAALFQKVVRQELAEGDVESAARHWCELSQRVGDLKPQPRFLLQIAPHLIAIGERREAGRALRMVMAADAGELTSGIALRVAELAREVHAPTALRAAQHVLATEGLDETKRAKLAGLVVELGKRAASEPQLDLDAVPTPESPADRSITIEPDDLGVAPPPSASASETDAGPAAGPLELSADGSLVSGGFDGDLSAGELVAIDTSPEESERSLSMLLESAARRDLPSDGERRNGSAASSLSESRAQVGAEPVTAHAEPRLEALEAASPLQPDRATDALDAIALATAAYTPRFHEAKIIDAIPVKVGEGRIELAQPGGRHGHIDFTRIQAIAVGAVNGISSKPVLVIDLLANWNEVDGGPLRTLRIRSDTFDALTLVPSASRPAEAFRSILETLLARSNAVPLPDPDGAHGRPFRVFGSLTTYEREVLLIDR